MARSRLRAARWGIAEIKQSRFIELLAADQRNKALLTKLKLPE